MRTTSGFKSVPNYEPGINGEAHHKGLRCATYHTCVFNMECEVACKCDRKYFVRIFI